MAEARLKRWPWLVRIVAVRPRLFLSALAGLALMFVLPADWRTVTRMLVGWDVGVGLYLILTYWMFAHCDIAHIRRQAALQDEGSFAILLLIIFTAGASFAAILVWLGTAPGSETHRPMDLALLFLTILLSWGFIHTIFALHYAHEFYAGERSDGGGLRFPGRGAPNYWDFVYFAFGIGTATQVSDVGITSQRIRKTVTLHGIVAFIFNVTILALTVSLAGDAISSG